MLQPTSTLLMVVSYFSPQQGHCTEMQWCKDSWSHRERAKGRSLVAHLNDSTASKSLLLVSLIHFTQWFLHAKFIMGKNPRARLPIFLPFLRVSEVFSLFYTMPDLSRIPGELPFLFCVVQLRRIISAMFNYLWKTAEKTEPDYSQMCAVEAKEMDTTCNIRNSDSIWRKSFIWGFGLHRAGRTSTFEDFEKLIGQGTE